MEKTNERRIIRIMGKGMIFKIRVALSRAALFFVAERNERMFFFRKKIEEVRRS